MSLQTAIERLEKSLWDTRTLPVRADIRTLLDAYYEATCDCCDNGKVWNNADPTSGQWVPCEKHGEGL